MKILFAAFDPFGGEKINPADEAVSRLPEKIRGTDIIKIQIPTIFVEDGEVLEDAIREYQPDAVVCVGQAGGRSHVSVEQVAINLIEARIPDNAGKQPTGVSVIEGGPTAYFSKLPVKAIVEEMKKNQIPAKVSYTAGTFVCNDIMYRLLHLIDTQYPDIQGGFIHVPYLPEQVLEMNEEKPSMSLPMMVQALEAVARVIEEST
ncbi:MAG: pyroglutamyl-peptidase I [Lachnospiraceae bacterium]|nr:pyroglutamyl-peptidase I [Lachnospiraceae bacterium]